MNRALCLFLLMEDKGMVNALRQFDHYKSDVEVADQRCDLEVPNGSHPLFCGTRLQRCLRNPSRRFGPLPGYGDSEEGEMKDGGAPPSMP